MIVGLLKLAPSFFLFRLQIPVQFALCLECGGGWSSPRGNANLRSQGCKEKEGYLPVPGLEMWEIPVTGREGRKKSINAGDLSLSATLLSISPLPPSHSPFLSFTLVNSLSTEGLEAFEDAQMLIFLFELYKC